MARDVAAVVSQLMQQINQMFMPPPPMPDPLVELRGKELDIKADDVQRKREEFVQRQQFDAMKAMQGNELAEQRLQIQKEIAMMKDTIARERIEQQNQFKAMDMRCLNPLKYAMCSSPPSSRPRSRRVRELRYRAR